MPIKSGAAKAAKLIKPKAIPRFLPVSFSSLPIRVSEKISIEKCPSGLSAKKVTKAIVTNNGDMPRPTTIKAMIAPAIAMMVVSTFPKRRNKRGRVIKRIIEPKEPIEKSSPTYLASINSSK